MDMTDTKPRIVTNEEEVFEFWTKEHIFEESLKKEAPNGSFAFNDGPPFATGTPHYGHLLASVIKDAIPRYKTMQGYKVERKWGWDCHGLPIENLIEKELGVSGRDEIINKIGIKSFNDACRAKIQEISDEWSKLIPRFGRWVDMDNPYKTMDTNFMESEWWAFKQLHEKGYIYEDFRSIHICPRCETTLSQSEVTEGYADIKDLSVVVKFALEDEPGTYILAWTTTPWTLPGNVALAVGKDIDYVKVKYEDKKYIVAKSRLNDVFKDKEFEIIEEMKGKDLLGKSYDPPFDYYKEADIKNKENIWKVYHADFVTDEDGTGIAHEAPAFGAEDMELAHKENLPFIQHVDMTGRFKEEVVDFAGMQVKPKDDHQATDVEIIKYLAKRGLLFDKFKVEHSYPHCWRCDTPLLNYATTSWFVAVEKMKSDLLKQAENIYWYPDHVKRGRWGRWLEGARDWSISRNRFWANTIPVWRCEECDNQVIVGSISELESLSGVKVDDLHKDVVDEVVWKCDKCEGEMKRIPDVLDTWFNSGSVPFATLHVPFENEEVFKDRHPADFVSEGADQTRAWFYYQHVLSTGLFNKPAFKNVIVSGIVLAEDGKKMSKKLKNYPDPMYMIDLYGSDAIRLYLLGSQAVRTEDLRFAEKEVDEIYKKTLMRLVNVYDFYAIYKDDISHGCKAHTNNPLDAWIVARFYQIHKVVTESMESYALDKAVRPLHDFVDDLSTWYVRRSRDRFKNEDLQDKTEAIETLRWTLRKFSKLIAPFAPFIADWMWMRIKKDEDPKSVHLANWCTVREYDQNILEDMKQIRIAVTSALDKRKEAGIRVRQPLQSLTINFDIPKNMLDILKGEVNVKEIIVDLSKDDIVLDTTLTEELKKEGIMREIVRAIQQERKHMNLSPQDTVSATLHADENQLQIAKDFMSEIIHATGLLQLNLKASDEFKVEIVG